MEDEQLLTPLCSVQTYLERRRRIGARVRDDRPAHTPGGGRQARRDGGTNNPAVFVAHPKEIGFESLELAARAVISGARLLTGSYVAADVGANGPISSRGRW